ncbi:MAG: GHKL domain-containing protein, partial [Mucilaginibacter polytrichastri]|nr:GHKL domain-containing protein [Mucilaginibacter polytrichastri]
VLINLAKNNGIIPYRHYLDNLILYSNAIQSILFSVALADKITFYRDQKNESQELALQIARENERLIVGQNHLLESEVKQRTKKLRETNQNLEGLLHDLRTAQTALVENEKMASLGQLTAGVAHEINNPINYVGANVKPLRMDIEELLLLLDKYKELENDPQNKLIADEIQALKKSIDVDLLEVEISTLLDGIEDGAQRTSEIVKSLRTFSRVDEQALKSADVNAGIRTTLVLLRQAMPEYIEIKMRLDELPSINCYPGKLNQVYMNLFNNSIHSITAKPQHNGEFISIETQNMEDEIFISISDSGTGMTEAVQKRIFEPFFTTKEVGEGTGLGMSIVFGIMEKHRGSIEVKSAPGKGTTIFLRVPKNLQEN